MRRQATERLYVELTDEDMADIVDIGNEEGLRIQVEDIPKLITALRFTYNDAKGDLAT